MPTNVRPSDRLGRVIESMIFSSQHKFELIHKFPLSHNGGNCSYCDISPRRSHHGYVSLAYGGGRSTVFFIYIAEYNNCCRKIKAKVFSLVVLSQEKMPERFVE